ncbi:hypothetical protein PM082_022336 [Marasmius tenuissimus]|nr:hypothetical protein PM082_022336 [Marasmius tenuissimus]
MAWCFFEATICYEIILLISPKLVSQRFIEIDVKSFLGRRRHPPVISPTRWHSESEEAVSIGSPLVSIRRAGGAHRPMWFAKDSFRHGGGQQPSNRKTQLGHAPENI